MQQFVRAKCDIAEAKFHRVRKSPDDARVIIVYYSLGC